MKKILFALLLLPLFCFSQNTEQIKTINMPVSTVQSTALALKMDVSSYQGLIQLAHATGVSGAALATTNLTFESGVALSTHLPMIAILKYASGTLGICVVEIDANAVAISATLAVVNLTSTKWNVMTIIPGVVANTGNLAVKVNTASLAASTFDIKIYGLKY